LSSVRSADARSRKIRRPEGVTGRLQVSRHKVQPPHSVRARNLLSKDDWRATLSDEPKPHWPEMTGIFVTEPPAGLAEGLAGAGAGPNRLICWPPGELEGKLPATDSGEEMAALSKDVGGREVEDRSLIDRRLWPEVAEPLCRVRVVFVEP
jgi:hypothetical protein